jgi:hypothetical protein
MVLTINAAASGERMPRGMRHPQHLGYPHSTD